MNDAHTLLSKLPAGAAFTVLGVNLDREVGRRLADMGFIEGAAGTIIRKKFWGGPMEIHILGYSVLLRRSEAAGIEVREAVGQAEGLKGPDRAAKR